MFKKALRSFSIRQARLRRERFQGLSSQIAPFQELCVTDPSRYERVLLVLKEELRLLVDKVFGARIRSRALYLAHEERPSKYFSFLTLVLLDVVVVYLLVVVVNFM